jgi:hypothetical protein
MFSVFDVFCAFIMVASPNTVCRRYHNIIYTICLHLMMHAVGRAWIASLDSS